MDQADGETDGGRWLSYAELAVMRGITRKAAVRMTQRHRWRRTPGNDGATRVFVPSVMTSRTAARLDARPDGPPDAPLDPTSPSVMTSVDAVLTALREAHAAEITTLRQTLTEAHAGEIARLTEAVATERERADALLIRGEADRAEVVVIQAKLAEAEHRLADAHAAAQKAQEQVEAYRRADADRKARGLVTRLRDALRGEWP